MSDSDHERRLAVIERQLGILLANSRADQDTSTASSVTFAAITDSGLTSTRVAYAGAAGLLKDSANLNFDGTNLTAAGSVTSAGVNSSSTVTITGPATLQLVIRSVATNNTRKNAQIVLTPYVSAQVPFGLVYGDVNTGADNQLILGGGTSAVQAATNILFYTATAVNTAAGTLQHSIDTNGDWNVTEGNNFILGTTTGTKFGTGTTQKIGFFNATPVVQQTVAAAAPAGGTGATAGAYDTAAHRDSAITLLNNIRTALLNLGLAV